MDNFPVDCLRNLICTCASETSTLIEKTKTKMKTNTLKVAAAIGLSALLAGSAAAQEESASKPVGYETLPIVTGEFNYLGLRLLEAPVSSGEVALVAGADVTLPAGVAAELSADTIYLFEVTSGDASGAVVVIDAIDAANDIVTLSDDLSDDFFDGESYTIRPASTLATVFGEENSAGLNAGQFGPSQGGVGADIIYVPNLAGGFDRYYYDDANANTFTPEWSNAEDQSVVDPTQIPIVYTDGIIILGGGDADGSFVVSGSVKLTETSYALTAGFNYLGTIFPAGSTLGSAFGAANESGLNPGEFGPSKNGVGADIIYVPTGGEFVRYYYDDANANTFAPAWTAASDQSEIDPDTVEFDDVSAIVILHDGPDRPATVQAPAFYSTL